MAATKDRKLTPKQERFCREYEEFQNLTKSILKYPSVLKNGYGNKYYVYFLINPITNTIFYIGKGKGKRCEDHLKEHYSGNLNNHKKHEVINSIVEKGMIPKIHVFENNMPNNDALTLERTLIRRFKHLITNESRGILGKYDKQKIWAQSVLLKIIPYKKWLLLRPRTEIEKQIYKEMVEIISEVANKDRRLYNKLTITQKNGISCSEWS